MGRFTPLASGDGVVVSTEEGELELRYNTTVADTSLLAGLRMEVFSWWQGDHGIIDTQDFDFRPNGVEIISTVTNAENITAINKEFFERVDENGDVAKWK